jgi:pyruvate formate lyase activating enzyme
MQFRGWQKTSLIEYPGKISTVLFTGSCNFKCPFCYNRDLVLNPGKLPVINESAVLEYLVDNRGLYHAVIVTGGEPTLQKGLPEFFSKVRDLDFLVGLETNGTNPVLLRKLIRKKLVDFVSLDVKAPLVWEKYKKAAGMSDKRLFENVLKSVKILLGSDGSHIDYEFRTTVVPKIHKEEDIVEIGKQIKGAKKYVLQQFLPKNTVDEKFSEIEPLKPEKLLRMRKKILKLVKACEIRNI